MHDYVNTWGREKGPVIRAFGESNDGLVNRLVFCGLPVFEYLAG